MTVTLGEIIADFTTQLATKIAVGGTTATLQSATDDDGVALPSGRYFFTIDGDNSRKEHISCTLSGTSLTAIKSVSRQGAETSGVLREHRVGATVSITDFKHIKALNDYLDGTTNWDSSVSIGYDGTATISNANHLATKAYVDATATGTTNINRLIFTGTAGETITIGQLVYLKVSDGRWWLADADTTNTVENIILGLAQGAGTAGNTITGGVLTYGLDTNQTGLTNNSVYYASNTAGGLSLTAGTTEVTVGYSQSTTSIFFNPRYNQQLTEDQQDALAGTSTSTPNASNKYVDNADTSNGNNVDQSQTTQDATVAVGEADATTKYYKIAQSFVAGKSPIVSVDLYKSANTGTYTGDVTIGIFADSGGSPTGSALATVTSANAAYNALSTGANTFTFSASYVPTLGTTYWIVISSSTADNSNHPNLGTNSAGGYASGSVKFNNTTDGWTAIATIDLYFKVNTQLLNKVVRYSSTGQVTVPATPVATTDAASKAYVDGPTLTIGEAVSSGDVVYLKKTDGKIYKAQADGTVDERQVLGIANEAGGLDESKSIRTQGVVSGFSFGNPTTTISETDDFSQATNDADRSFGDGGTTQLFYQSFVTGDSVSNLSKVNIQLKKVGAPAASITIAVFKQGTSEADGTTPETGSALASRTFVEGGVTTSYVTYDVLNGTPISVEPRTRYLIKITTTQSNGANYWSVGGQDGTADSYSYEYGMGYSSATTWTFPATGSANAIYLVTRYTEQRNYYYGDNLYLSDTAGAILTDNTGTIRQKVGRLLSPSSMFLEPSATGEIIDKVGIYNAGTNMSATKAILFPIPRNTMKMKLTTISLETNLNVSFTRELDLKSLEKTTDLNGTNIHLWELEDGTEYGVGWGISGNLLTILPSTESTRRLSAIVVYFYR